MLSEESPFPLGSELESAIRTLFSNVIDLEGLGLDRATVSALSYSLKETLAAKK
jgi:hypothetical protein